MMKALQRILNTLLTALLTAALTLGATGCTNHEMPDAGSLLPDTGPGRKITIHASTGQEAGTRVAYDDTQVGATPNKALTWQAEDRLTVVGMAEGAYVNHKDDYEYQGEPGETSGDFVGTEIAGADSWSIYYPNTVNVDTDTGLASLSMEGQTQTANGSTDHLRNYLLLAATDVKDINHFGLQMKNSIMKFVISGVKTINMGKLRKLVWEVETEEGIKSIALEYTGGDINFGTIPSPTLTAYLAFDPTVMKVKDGGQFSVTLMGNNHYRATTQISGGKTYEPGKRYTATIDGNGIEWTEGANSMKLTISISNNGNFNIPFPIDGTTPADITVDWGDATVTRVPKGTALKGDDFFSHRYIPIQGQTRTFTITITSDQLDETQQQIPEFNFKYRTENDNRAKLISIDSPLLNTGATDFNSCFSGCTALKSIPQGLFDKNPQVTNFSECFSGCIALKSIPGKLFYMNRQVKDFSYCFSGCTALESIPGGFFSNSKLVTSFSGCFSGCTALQNIPNGLFRNNKLVTSFSDCFSGCKALQSIPEDLFNNHPQVTDFSYCFKNCTALQSIPAIFASKNQNKERVSFESCFENCESLQTIAENLFSKFENIKSFASCFASCYALQSVPPKLLDSQYCASTTNFKECFMNCHSLVLNKDIFGEPKFEKNTSFNSCFKDAGSNLKPGEGGEAPELWKKSFKSTSSCFRGAKNVTNWSDIPESWGGSYTPPPPIYE